MMDQVHEHHMQMDGMKMYFHFGFEKSFLFSCFNVDTPVKLWLTCGLLFFLSIIYEAVKYVRCVRCGCQMCNKIGTNLPIAKNDQVQRDSEAGDCCSQRDDNNTSENSGSGPIIRDGGTFRKACLVGNLRHRKHRILQTALHTIQTIIAYVLMLAVMSFNVCVIFAIIVGEYISSNLYVKGFAFSIVLT